MTFRSVIAASIVFGVAGGVFLGSARGQIPKPDDAPRPMSPGEQAKTFKLPAGLRMELVASEPLVREPSGMCWDERGRLFAKKR